MNIAQTSESRAENCLRATRQEQDYVRRNREPSFRIASSKPVDVISFTRHGVEVTDCKFSDSKEFIIDKKDISKGLLIVRSLKKLGFDSVFCVDMHFPRERIRKKITITNKWKGKSLKVSTDGVFSVREVS